MTGWLPYPLASALLLAMWLLLNQSLSVGHVLLGGALAVVGPLTLAALEVPKGTIRRPGAIARLFARVVADIVRSNVAVARLILGRGRPGRASGFVTIPLAMRDAFGLAALACIITATPGTTWVSFDAAEGTLVIHVLDLIDDEDWVSTIKHRYERLLMEIFE